MILKIISGGQFGAERGALDAALTFNVATGGTASFGWRCPGWDPDPDPFLASLGLVECPDEEGNDKTRITLNCTDGDGTLFLGNPQASFAKLNSGICTQLNKPFLNNPTEQQFADWIAEHGIEVLNVAGNRGRSEPEMYNRAIALLTAILS